MFIKRNIVQKLCGILIVLKITCSEKSVTLEQYEKYCADNRQLYSKQAKDRREKYFLKFRNEFSEIENVFESNLKKILLHYQESFNTIKQTFNIDDTHWKMLNNVINSNKIHKKKNTIPLKYVVHDIDEEILSAFRNLCNQKGLDINKLYISRFSNPDLVYRLTQPIPYFKYRKETNYLNVHSKSSNIVYLWLNREKILHMEAEEQHSLFLYIIHQIISEYSIIPLMVKEFLHQIFKIDSKRIENTNEFSRFNNICSFTMPTLLPALKDSEYACTMFTYFSKHPTLDFQNYRMLTAIHHMWIWKSDVKAMESALRKNIQK